MIRLAHATALIHDLLSCWAVAVRARDAGAVIATYAAEVVNYDIAPPLRLIGEEALALSGYEGWFATWAGPIGVEHHEFRIFAGDDLAFAHGLMHLTGKRTDGEHTDIWVRQTFGMCRKPEGWRILHEHTSVPFYMDGSYRAAVDLKP